MKSPRRWVALCVLLLLVIAFALFSGGRPGREDARSAPGLTEPDDVAPREVWSGPPPPVSSEEAIAVPGPLAQAHEQLAERLGYHAVRCWAGREYGDMRIASGFDTRIEGGWFLSLERRPTGDHTYQDTFQPLEDGPTDYVDVIRVVWNGQPEDRVVPCKVLNEAYAEVDVLLVDDDGRPLEGGWLMGCRGRWSTDERGRASLQVQADLLSMYEKMTREREALQAVRDETPGLPGEQLDLILEAQTDALQTQADLLGEMGLL